MKAILPSFRIVLALAVLGLLIGYALNTWAPPATQASPPTRFVAAASAAPDSNGSIRPTWSAAEPDQAPQANNAPSPPRLVAQALANLEQCDTLSAKLRFQTELFGQTQVGAGTYVQGPARLHLSRLELRLQLDEETNSLLQVCDGRTLWTYREALGKRSLERIDIRQIVDASQNFPGAAARLGTTTSLGLGGLPQLLVGLERLFDWTAARPAQLGTLPVWSVSGTWKPERLKQFLPEQTARIEAGEPVNLELLPEHLPHRVVLYLGQDDLFPYRLEYWRSVPDASGYLARWWSKAPTDRALAVLELFDVQINGSIDTLQFAYHPSMAKIKDTTPALLELLGLDGSSK